MKNLLFLLLVSAFCLSVQAQQKAINDADIALIKKIIQTAYVEGLQNEGDTVKINSGFNSGFEMLMPTKEGELKKYSLTVWKEKIKANLATGLLPRKGAEKISVKFLSVDVTGNAAVAKFEFYTGPKLTFVDYLSLYKFGDKWEIVSKIFHKL
jgi:hypothetical protein